ncbi:MAG TPA: multicopper oxidase domain-containing protein [Candidatus Limnocylindrales bacterium]
MVTRREFLKVSAATGVALSVPWGWAFATPPPVRAFSQSDRLRKFVQPLRGLGPGGIPVAQPDTVNPGWWQPGVTHYTMGIGEYEDLLHPDLPNPTRLFGFGQNGNFRHLGGIIAVKRGTPVQITFRNHLPARHILPIDKTIMGADGPQNRANVHLHGGLVPWTSDGGPHAWWDPSGNNGPSFINNQVLRPGHHVPAGEAEYYYPNNQGSRLLWYHDHTFGFTRTNAYAGVASAYVIYDDYELSLVSANHLPGPLDPRTTYLVFQDKIFVSRDIEDRDPSWAKIMPHSRPGDLWYAHQYEAARWEIGPQGTPPAISAIPEFFGDTVLVNGTVYPYLEVEKRQYRLRLLNACNARFLNPRLYYAKGKSFPANAEPNLAAPGPAFVQFGTEGGFLPQPAVLNAPNLPTLLMAPAERADLIVDFRDVPAGSTLILFSDAEAPYPMGDPVNDRHPGDGLKPSSLPGYGPNTETLLQIRVKPRSGVADPPITLPKRLDPTDPFLVNQKPGQPTAVPPHTKVRRLTLNETFDEFGRLIQFLGTDQAVNGDFGRAYMDTPTEVIQAGTTEVWEIVNLTGDTHPIHFHLVNVQVLSRQAFDPDAYAGGAPGLLGDPFAPDRNELGWKETVRMNPSEVTRVLMRFDLPTVPFTVPASPRLLHEYGIKGAEYVWHCHILEHEEHDMMRPFAVV